MPRSSVDINTQGLLDVSAAMEIRLGVVCCVLSVVFGFASGYAQAPDEYADPGALARVLHATRVPAKSMQASLYDLAQQLQAGEDPASIEVQLLHLAAKGAPSPGWFEVMMELQAVKGDSAARRQTLEQGYAAYPYSTALSVLHLQQQLAGKDSVSYGAVFKTSYPDPAKALVAMQLAFQRQDVVNGLLYGELGFFAGRPDPYGRVAGPMISQLYTVLLDPEQVTALEEATTYPSGSFEEAYLRCLLSVAQSDAFRAQTWVSAGHRAGLLRAATLRRFADQGWLGRFDRPSLVDLYVLDRAGHLEALTAYSFKNMLSPADWAKTEAHYGKSITAGRTYCAERWSTDVAAFEAKAQPRG